MNPVNHVSKTCRPCFDYNYQRDWTMLTPQFEFATAIGTGISRYTMGDRLIKGMLGK